MKRVFAVLAVLLALMFIGVVVHVVTDDEPAPVEIPDARPTAPEPPPPPLPKAEPPVAAAAAPEAAPPPAPAPEPPPQVARGYLDVVVNAPGKSSIEAKLVTHVKERRRFDTACRLTVCWPTGEEIASTSIAVPGRARFGPLPHGAPLVLRVEREGWLTGLCCDVNLQPDLPLVKMVDLVPAPMCGFRMVSLSRPEEPRAFKVSIQRGDSVLATGESSAVKGGGGTVTWAFVPAIGSMRVVVYDDDNRRVADVPFSAWPSAEPVVKTIYVGEPNSVLVFVSDAAGSDATGATVWLTSDYDSPRSAIVDKRGKAVFEALTAGRVYEISTRASDGSVARTQFMTSGDEQRKVALTLGKPGTLVGDVVDEGNSAVVGARVEVSVVAFSTPYKAQSDATGAFSVGTLPAGLAQVVVRAEGFLDWRPDEPVLLVPQKDVRIRARLRRVPQGAVVVTVRDEDGKPVAGAAVDVLPARRTARTAADGTCRIDGLPANTDQFAFAKKRGWRTRTEAQWNPAVVTVQTDMAVATEIVLRTAGADVKRGPASLKGVVLDPSGAPVIGARVECASSFAFTTLDGSFRLDGLPPATRVDPVEFRVLPGPGLVQPLSVFVDLDATDVVDFGVVRLRARPVARIVAPRAAGSASPFAAFWLSTNHGESLLGASTGRFEPLACVSYDGTWLHLPPADDWRLDGRGEVFVAQPTAHGLRTATSSWTLAPDAAPRLEPAFVGEPQTVVVSVDGRDRDLVLLTQKTCATLFDPRSIHVPTGNPQPPVDPFASLVAERSIELGEKGGGTLRDVAPGTWIATFRGSANSVVEFTVPGATTVIVRR